jgi:hypothetical protein
MNAARAPDLQRALRLVPSYERAVREVSRMLSEAGIRHALVGALGSNAYRNRPRTTEDIDFLVGDEAFERHEGGFVTMRVPVVEFDGISIDQVPLTGAVGVIAEGLNHPSMSDGVPIAPLETIVIMKLLAGRTSGADREALRAAVRSTSPTLIENLERLFANVDRDR